MRKSEERVRSIIDTALDAVIGMDERGHILEGLAVALSNVDEIIELIKTSPTPAEAKQRLLGQPWKSSLVQEMLARSDIARSRPDGLTPDLGLHPDGYRLSEAQAQRILEMQEHATRAESESDYADQAQNCL